LFLIIANRPPQGLVDPRLVCHFCIMRNLLSGRAAKKKKDQKRVRCWHLYRTQI